MTRNERAEARKARMVVHRAADFSDAEPWDLRFWQAQGPEARLEALVAIHEDVAAVQTSRGEASPNVEP